MAISARAGELFYSVAFEKQGEASDDGRGGVLSAWVEQFRCRAGFIHLRGGEAVQAARLEGNHVQIVRVRSSAASRAVTTDWRVVDTRTGQVYNIRDIEPSLDRRTIDFTCQRGVAT